MKLYNRDGYKVWLEEVGENDWWQLKTDQPELFKYIRILLEKDNTTIYAVDPPGGPFLSLGMRLEEKYTVEEIKSTSLGVFIRLKSLYIEYEC